MSTDAARDNGTVTKPGVYPWMPDATYHADPVPGGSLSASGAKLLLPPSCPARFAWYRQHGRPPKAEFDLGHAAHLLALGAGPDLEIIDAADWRTKAAKEARDKAREAGRVPVLERQWVEVQGMATVLREHPIAGELLNPETMRPEVSVFWRDLAAEPAVMLRARLDAVSKPDAAGDPIVVDYKTCRSADIDHISRAMWTYGYALQAAWYLDAAASLADEPWDAKRFLFVFQEVDPPHVVTVVEPDSAALYVGQQRSRQAIDIYRACVVAGQWPGHVPADSIPTVGLPAWAERQYVSDTEYDEVSL